MRGFEPINTDIAARQRLLERTNGAFEMQRFDRATVALAKGAASLTHAGKPASIAGGGDTVAALNLAGAAKDFTYVSTVGGAFLKWLEGKDLPAIAALRKAATVQ